jgi:two-component system, NarL family, nitrate/nitrite response regulator NarL
MKFLLVEDHALFRHGLLLLLDKLPGDHQYLESETCEAAFALTAVHRDLDLILLDLALPGMNGLDGLDRLRALCPDTPIVLLSASENPRFIVDGMRRGAQGFIPKSTDPETMVAALQRILLGCTYVPALATRPAAARDEQTLPLTQRQREVLALLAKNCSNKEIAEALGMRVNTVRVHVAAILSALCVDNRVEAAQVALGMGM